MGVVSRSRKPCVPSVAVEDVAGADRWVDVGSRLRELEPDEYARLLALAEGFVLLHERDLESAEQFRGRIAFIRRATSTPS